MESIKASSLKSKEQIIDDLKDLLNFVNDGKEGYQSAAETTGNIELKSLFSKYSGERIVYAAELKEHITVHGGQANNEAGGILGGLHRTWINFKELVSSKEDKPLLTAITEGERAAIARYDQYIADYADHADHLALLKEHRQGISQALSEVERRIIQSQ